MIWLFCKKKNKTKHKLLTCVFQHKERVPPLFLWSKRKRLKRKRRGARRAKRDTKENGLDSRPSPPKKHTERLVGCTEPRVKGERKGLFCAFRPSGAQRRIRTSIQPHEHTLTTHAHAHTCICWKVALTSLSVLGQPENSAQPSVCFPMLRSRCGNTGLVAQRLAHAANLLL